MAVKKEISEALHRITHGVYVISTKHNNKINAMTAAWVARAPASDCLAMKAR